MRAHTPPFTKPEAAYDSRRMYEETSVIAAAQDARHAMTDAERESKLRTVAHYIYHAKLLMDEVFSEERRRSKDALRDMVRESERLDLYSNADTPAKSPHDDFTIAQDPPDLPLGWLARGGVPAESSYIASFAPKWSPQWLADQGAPADPRKIARFDKDGSRLATADEVAALREHLTAEQLREYGIGDVERRHPMHAEALRDHDERLFGGEDRL